MNWGGTHGALYSEAEVKMIVLERIPCHTVDLDRTPAFVFEPPTFSIGFFGWDDAGYFKFELTFHAVESVKITYLAALPVDDIPVRTYELVEICDSAWVRLAMTRRVVKDRSVPLKHLRILAESGPCYEFLCERYDSRIEHIPQIQSG